MRTTSPDVAKNEPIVRRCLDSYSRRKIFGCSLFLHSVFLVYSPDDTNVYGAVIGEFEKIGSK